MLNLKRLAAVGMAAIMTMGLGMTSLAAEVSAVNFTTAPGTAYTTLLNENNGYEAVLGVGPASASYAFEGYTSADDAVDSTTGAWVPGSNIFVGTPVKGSEKISEGVYATTFTAKGERGKYGAASLLTSNVKNSKAYLNLTVYQEAADDVNVPNANVKVTLTDVSELNDLVVNESKEVTVQPAAKDDATNKFKDQENCAQTYPTAGDALYKMVGSDFAQYGGYVNSVTATVLNEEEEESIVLAADTIGTDYYGWNYCVIRDGKIVQGSAVMSASVFDIKTNDHVCWAYGTSDQANAYFATLVTAN